MACRINPGPGIEPGPPALGAQRISNWTMREVPDEDFLLILEEENYFIKIDQQYFNTMAIYSETSGQET